MTRQSLLYLCLFFAHLQLSNTTNHQVTTAKCADSVAENTYAPTEATEVSSLVIVPWLTACTLRAHLYE